MELNIKSDFQAMETTVITIAKVHIFLETPKCFPLVFSVNPCFLKNKNHQAFSSPDGLFLLFA